MFKQLDGSNNLNVNCKVIDKLIHHIRDPNSVKLKTEIPKKFIWLHELFMEGASM